MISITRSAFPLLFVALFGVLTGGCARTHDGNAVPVSTASANSIPSTPRSVDGASDFGELKACDLLDKALQGKGFQPVQVETLSGPNGCSSDKSMYASISISLQAGSPYDQLDDSDRDKQFPGDVNGRRAIQIRDILGGEGGCAVMMEVGPKSRVLVNTNARMTTDQACDFVGSIAKAVEPMLPKVR